MLRLIDTFLQSGQPALREANAGRASHEAAITACLEVLRSIEWESIAGGGHPQHATRACLSWTEPSLAGAVHHSRGKIRDIAELQVDGLVEWLQRFSRIANHPPRGTLKMYTGGRLDQHPITYTGTLGEQNFGECIRYAEFALQELLQQWMAVLEKRDFAVVADPFFRELLDHTSTKLADVHGYVETLVRFRQVESAWVSNVRGYTAPFLVGGVEHPGPNLAVQPSLACLSIAFGCATIEDVTFLRSRAAGLLPEQIGAVETQLLLPSVPSLLVQKYDALTGLLAVNQCPTDLAQAALFDLAAVEQAAPEPATAKGIDLASITERSASIFKQVAALKRAYTDAVSVFACKEAAVLRNNTNVIALRPDASFEGKKLNANNIARQTLIQVAELLDPNIRAM
ncbi:MAG: hypothetical protein SGI91_15225 [Alphaproteobacteria bacterium]|nr:hypothetical protein [Alphaproteobacteria bacterium]